MATLTVTHGGHTVTVTKSEAHPVDYMYLHYPDGRMYFLGCYEAGMSRADVRRMARQMIELHHGTSTGDRR